MASSRKPPPAELPARLAGFLKHNIHPGQTLLLAFSGGLDSCVLLDLLQGAQDHVDFQLRAAHVNHGLSPNAAAWEDFCAALCAARKVPFQALHVHLPADGGLGLEAAARAARYGALLAQPGDALVLAHHQDDQAETLLLQLLRGAGVKGLAAMPAVSRAVAARRVDPERAPDRLVPMLRPLLDVPRAVLEDYARRGGLCWIEDESNLNLAFDRNFLRHQVFSQLQKRFPACHLTLARAAAHLGEADELLREVAAADAALWVHEGRLKVAGLAAMSLARAKNLLRHWLGTWQPEPPNTRRLEEIYRQLLTARADAQICLALPGGRVHRYRGEAWFEPKGGTTLAAEQHWHGEAELEIGAGRLRFCRCLGAGLSLSRLGAASLSVRPRSSNERFRPDARRPARRLRQLFQQAGVPAWRRQGLPLLYLNERLVVVPGIGVASDLQALAGEEGLLVEWLPAG